MLLLYGQTSTMHFIKAITCICIKLNQILILYVSMRAVMKFSAFSSWLRMLGTPFAPTLPPKPPPWRMGVVVFVLRACFFPRELHFPEGSPSGRPALSFRGQARQHHERWVFSVIHRISLISLDGFGSAVTPPRHYHSTRDTWECRWRGSPFGFLACSRL